MTADLGALVLAAAAAVQGTGPVERAVVPPGPGPVVVTLDADVYSRAREDLGDLRVRDDAGRAVPYLVDRAREEPPDRHRPALRDRVFDRGAFARVTLDFGRPTLKDELTLALSGASFRRRVVVEGRGRHDPVWATLTDDAYVFAVPGPPEARYETVRLPENNFAELRVTVFHDDDDPARIEILDAWTPVRAHRRPREAVITPRLSRAHDPEAKETIVTLDLGSGPRPYLGVVLDVADARFWRGVSVESRLEPRGGQPLAWSWVADRAVWRCVDPARCAGAGDADAESLRLDVCGRARVLRLRVRDRDDAPLDVRGAVVRVPVERLAFEAEEGRTYTLSYGDRDLTAPSYDLVRTAGDPALFAARATEAPLAPPVAAPARPAGERPWTERHPALLWGGLVAVVAALGLVTWQALRAS